MEKSAHAIVGFDAHGKLKSMGWIDDGFVGLDEKTVRRECRKGGLAVRKVTEAEARELMIEHGWVKRPAPPQGEPG